MIKTNSVGRVCSALQRALLNCEAVGGRMPIFRIGESQIVQDAIQQQKENYRSVSHTKNRGADPHNGLKDLLQDQDKLTIL